MQEMQQGEEYEEFEDEELDYDDESAEDISSNYIFGLPKKVVFIGVPILVILTVGLIIFALRRDSAGSSDSVKVGSITVYDESGEEIGTIDSTEEGSIVYDLTGTEVATVSESGSMPLYDKKINLIAMCENGVTTDDPMGETSDGVIDDSGVIEESGDNYSDDGVIIEESNDIVMEPSDYSDDDVTMLRALGYTGDEIELAMSNGLDIEALKEDAEKVRDEEAKKALARMSDSASDEFKEIVNNSIFCQPYKEFQQFDANASTFHNSTGSYIVNADYQKVPTYGYQLYIKCKIANGTYAFMDVEPSRWETLPEEGNIVLQIDYIIYGTDITSMYIKSITEIDITKTTVNPQDSAQDLESILNESTSGLEDNDYDDEEIADDDMIVE